MRRARKLRVVSSMKMKTKNSYQPHQSNSVASAEELHTAVKRVGQSEDKLYDLSHCF